MLEAERLLRRGLLTHEQACEIFGGAWEEVKAEIDEARTRVEYFMGMTLGQLREETGEVQVMVIMEMERAIEADPWLSEWRLSQKVLERASRERFAGPPPPPA